MPLTLPAASNLTGMTEPPLMMKLAMPVFPHPNPPPEGEGANESLREFHVKYATSSLATIKR